MKARLKLEPKSRLFYPLAEELRKISRLEEAEKILRDGLMNHGSYTSAWISFGRVLFEQRKYLEAVEALQRAFTLDPGNVVAARLLADSFLGMGEKVEAIKKYKLVRALLPSDEGVEAAITRLEVELHKPTLVEAPKPVPLEPMIPAPDLAPAPPREEDEIPRHPVTDEPVSASEATSDTEPFVASEPAVPLTTAVAGEGAVQAVDVDAAISGARFTSAADPYAEEIVSPRAEVVGEAEVAEEEERDFPPADATPPDDLALDQQETIEEPLSSLRAPAEAETEPPPFATPTIANLYAQQGHHNEAREIYNKLDSGIDNQAAEPALAPGTPQREKVARLETWLTRVTRK